MFSLVWLALAIVPLLTIASSLYNLFLHPLSKVPGPKIYAISQLPYLYQLAKGDWHRLLRDLHKEYGPVVRYSPRDVSFNSNDAFKKIYAYKTDGKKDYEKDPSSYQRTREAYHLLNAPHAIHRRLRRVATHAFSAKALSNQETVLQHYAKLFVKNIGIYSQEQGGLVDIIKWYNFATFDLLSDLSFGKSFGSLDNGEYHPWVRTIFETFKAIPLKQVFIRLNIATVAAAFIPADLKKRAKDHFEYSAQMAMQRVESNDTTREDFMSYILQHNDEKGMTMDELTENSNLIILAGSETTSSALSGVTYYTLRHHSVYNKLVREIRSCIDTEDEITVARVSKLEYLDAVFKEGLRLYPPAAVSLLRLVPTGGDFIGGYWIPENTTVSISHWVTFRSAAHFHDPEAFVPERWLGDPRYVDDHKDMFQPFSTGPRNCIGLNLANANVKLILARLLWKFDVELAHKSSDWPDQNLYAIWEKKPLPVRLTEAIRG